MTAMMKAPMKVTAMRAQSGFTIVEFVIATALLVGLTAAVFAATNGAPDAFAVQHETADMHQRLRAAVGALERELIAATAVRPYRWGGAAPDPPGAFRPDTITIVGARTVVYWLKRDDAAQAYQLMTDEGGAAGNVPVVDHVVDLTFTYFADGAAGTLPLAASELADGPWLPDPADPACWDADLERIRSVVVSLRVQSADAALRGPAGRLFVHAGTAASARRWAPDVSLQMVVSPRNLNRNR